MSADPSDNAPRRPVRSFVRREGRMTPGQRRALARLGGRYLLRPPAGKPLDLDAVYGRRAPRWLEIGAGNGACTASLAEAHPENDYLAAEVHGPGMGHLLQAVEQRGLANVRGVQEDVWALLPGLPAGGLEGVLVFFPDPWPKKRHHKRRLVQVDFLRGLAPALADHGRLFLATDDADYAAAMAAAALAAGYRNLAPAGFAPRPHWRPLTRFESRGLRLGHAVYDLMLAPPGPAAAGDGRD